MEGHKESEVMIELLHADRERILFYGSTQHWDKYHLLKLVKGLLILLYEAPIVLQF